MAVKNTIMYTIQKVFENLFQIEINPPDSHDQNDTFIK